MISWRLRGSSAPDSAMIVRNSSMVMLWAAPSSGLTPIARSMPFENSPMSETDQVLSLLLVEDERQIRRFVRTALEAEGWQVVEAETMKLAEKIAEKAPIALQLSKEAVKFASRSNLDEGLRREVDLFAICFSTEDKKEGVAAFLEKRKPNFTGK